MLRNFVILILGVFIIMPIVVALCSDSAALVILAMVYGYFLAKKSGKFWDKFFTAAKKVAERFNL